MAAEPLAVVVTCEHAGNELPGEWAHLFDSPEARAALESHRGWDIGALDMAGMIARRLSAPLLAWPVSRLLIESNRSLDAPDLFSSFSRGLSDTERAALVERYYRPYRSSIERLITAMVAMGHRVLHLAVHSCTDELNGVKRELELGLLFDPARLFEVEITGDVRAWFDLHAKDYRLRFNEPYLGTDDGLTSFLRTCFPDRAYAGIELEFRQGFLSDESASIALAEATATAIERLRTGSRAA